MEHVIGGVGTVLVLAAYFLVPTGRLQSKSYGFQGMNFVGAGSLAVYALLLVAWDLVAELLADRRDEVRREGAAGRA